LARDVVTLTRLAAEKKENLPLISAIKRSNDEHREWNYRRLRLTLGELRGRVLAVLGLTYKPGTDTLRRSAAVELCRKLVESGAQVRAVDPVVKQVPSDLSKVELKSGVIEALAGAEAVVVCTEWPEFRQVDWSTAVHGMTGRLVLDANGFLGKELNGLPVQHVVVGVNPS